MSRSKRIARGVAILALFLPAAGASADEELPPRAERLVAEADELAAAGHFDTAVRRYQRASRIADGRSFDIALRLVRALVDAGRYAKAVAEAAEARELARTPAARAELAYLAGRSYYESAHLADFAEGKQAQEQGLEMAKTFFADAGRTSPETVPQVFYLLGRIFEGAGDRQYASEFYVDYLKRDPSGRYADLARARLQYLQGPRPPVLVNGDLSPPAPVELVAAEYTREAEEAGLSGDVVVAAVFDETGTPTVLEVVKGLPFGLSEAVLEAIEQSEFEPARDTAGRAVPAYQTLIVAFRPGVQVESISLERVHPR